MDTLATGDGTVGPNSSRRGTGDAIRKGDNPWGIADRLPGSHLNQAATPLASHRCEPVWGI